MDRDSIIKFYFSLGMRYGDILSALASQDIVIHQSILTWTSLVLSTLCAGFKYFKCTFYYFVRTFTKSCTWFVKRTHEQEKKNMWPLRGSIQQAGGIYIKMHCQCPITPAFKTATFLYEINSFQWWEQIMEIFTLTSTLVNFNNEFPPLINSFSVLLQSMESWSSK